MPRRISSTRTRVEPGKRRRERRSSTFSRPLQSEKERKPYPDLSERSEREPLPSLFLTRDLHPEDSPASGLVTDPALAGSRERVAPPRPLP
ncbi:hypothetical protein MATL_G00260550 [Megalops atlanticus]|uniref:Uncharacterized protein n=1 Tax=Megalops atlanticus TaxID=7932 RepID=A0A9D3SU23_MEGAT|nr:hypothetical protein MATL_G00260550 [Megalops atlanticus]